MSPTMSASAITTPVASSGAAFLSRFPRSLSQLNMKKKSSTERPSLSGNQVVISPNANPNFTNIIDINNVNTVKISSPTSPMHHEPIASSLVPPVMEPYHNHNSNNKKIKISSPPDSNEIPPPLPQRNIPKKSLPNSPINNFESKKKSVEVSDLDSSFKGDQVVIKCNYDNGNDKHLKKKSKNKQKALSDPKMSSQTFIQMENLCYPPPLPPRQPQFMSGTQVINNQSMIDGFSPDSPDFDPALMGRPLPNSINTAMNYPLVSITTSVRDNHLHHAKPSHLESMQNSRNSSVSKKNIQNKITHIF
jgi:hypothetical protein